MTERRGRRPAVKRVFPEKTRVARKTLGRRAESGFDGDQTAGREPVMHEPATGSAAIWLGAACALLMGATAAAKDSGLVFVSNEKSNTITVLDANDTVIKTIETCARPRGVHFSQDRTQFYVGCADDSMIVTYDVATQALVGRIRNVEEPETFDLHPDGRHLYVSNEEDAAASVYDVKTGELIGEFETGEEPEGVLFTADGKRVFVASEANNLVHVIDVEAQAVVKDILVDTRPRRFALTPDEKELWVSAELAGIVDIIDTQTLELIGDIPFLPTGFRKEQVTPVDLLITRDGKRGFVAPSHKVTDYILVGKRPWGLALNHDESRLYVANGLSDDITIIDTASLKPLKSIPVGRVPYGILIDDH
jgi:PQQ-dependent catabolism-associated beta-propeller protein